MVFTDVFDEYAAADFDEDDIEDVPEGAPEKIEAVDTAKTAISTDNSNTVNSSTEPTTSEIKENAAESQKKKPHQTDDDEYFDDASFNRNLARQLRNARSVYVSNVDYSASKSSLNNYFSKCGFVEQVTILKNRWTGRPIGAAYIEFADPEFAKKAVRLDGTYFFRRQITVAPTKVMKKYDFNQHCRAKPHYGNRSGRRYAPY